MRYNFVVYLGVAILLISVFPGAHAIEVGGGISLQINDDRSSSEGYLYANQVGTSSEIVSNGIASFEEYHWRSDPTGKYCEVGASIINGDNPYYRVDILPKGDPDNGIPDEGYYPYIVPGVLVKQTLSVGYADQINCHASATNVNGDQANGYINLENGLLTGYFNEAYADNSYVHARQGLQQAASDSSITIGTSASNEEGDTAAVNSVVSRGFVEDYEDCSEATTTQATASLSGPIFSGSGISFYWYANNLEGDTINGGPAVTLGSNTVVYNGQASYANLVMATEDSVSAGPDIRGEGERIWLGWDSSNKNGDLVDGGVDVKNGDIHYSNPYMSATIDSAITTPYVEATGADIWLGWEGSNEGGDVVNGMTEVKNGHVVYLNPSAKATEDSVTTNPCVDANGAEVSSGVYAYNKEGDAAYTGIDVQEGSLNGYSSYEEAKVSNAFTQQVFDSVSGKQINIIATANNQEGDKVESTIEITDGSINRISALGTLDSGWAVKTGVSTDLNIEGVTQTQMRTHSFAENKKPAYEYIKPNKIKLYEYGGGEFEVRNVPATIHSVATNDGIVILSDLPDDTRKAIILEPFEKIFDPAPEYDLRATVFQRLVDKGYATTRYTDSAVSIGAVQEMDDYNIALVAGHMTPGAIGLSSDPHGVIRASQLEYTNPPTPSFVILAGCESFKTGKKEEDSALSTATISSDLRGGFSKSVNYIWPNIYISEFLAKMADGSTASEANDYVWNLASKKYLIFKIPGKADYLHLIGDTSFKL
jgi:hypothetical protein